MPITYDPQHRLFKLDTNLSTYAFMVYEENYLVHLYYCLLYTSDAADEL